MTEYTEPSEDALKPLLKKARSVGGRKWPNQRAVALFDPTTGELISGPRTIGGSERIEWSNDGIEAKGSGPFTSYDDLKRSWRYNAQQRESHEQRKQQR